MRLRLLQPRIRRAFTLVEVMMAIAIFMMVMGTIIACWRCIISGKMIAEDAAAAAQRARVGIRSISDALTCAEISAAPTSIPFYAFLNDTSGKFASLSLAARLPSDFPGSGLFGDQVVRRVTFDVEAVDGTNNLIMYQSPLLEALDERNTPYPITLARDVNVFMLEFWSVRDGEWVVSFDPTNQFPPMIRVSLGVGHSPSHPDVPYDLIVHTVAMPCQAH